MPEFSTEIAHQLGKEQATEKLKSFLDKVSERYKDQVSDLKGDWADNVLTFALTTFGFTVDGVLTVEEDSANLKGKLPFAAAMFKGKIESSIASELEKALS
jgi:putative polyhydroxyalkanoate system protein